MIDGMLFGGGEIKPEVNVEIPVVGDEINSCKELLQATVEGVLLAGTPL